MTKTTKQPSPRTVARKLRALARQMRQVGSEMEYIGGFDDQMTDKAVRLMVMSWVVDKWADVMAKEGGR